MARNTQDSEALWGWQSQLKSVTQGAQYLLENETLSDVVFRVGPKDGATVDIKAHKFLLAMRSAVFEAMFYGNLAESGGLIRIHDIDETTFRILLRYMYDDIVGEFNDCTVFSTMYAAKKYGIPLLQAVCEEHVRNHVTANNCLAWLVQARRYDEENLAQFCLETADSLASAVIESEEFLHIDIEILREILKRDTFSAKEVNICSAALKWAVNQGAQKESGTSDQDLRSVLSDTLFLIRFPIMTGEEVANGPVKMGLLLDNEIVELFQFFFANRSLTANFICTKRRTRLTAFRFREVRERGWTYTAGTPDMIGFSIAQQSMTATIPKKVFFVGVGIYAPVSVQRDVECTVTVEMYLAAAQTRYGRGGFEKGEELTDFRQSFTILPREAGSKVQHLKLNKAAPLEFQRIYIVSALTTGVQESSPTYPHGVEGRGAVPLSGRESSATVQFYNCDYSAIPSPPTVSCGNTMVSSGQLPELYFEIED